MTAVSKEITVSLALDRAINFAFQQNAIPILRELRLANPGPTELRGLRVSLSTEPAFALPQELQVEAVPAGGEFRVAPIDLKLSPDFLAGLNERVAGLLHVEVSAGPTTLARHSESITLLARNEWCGLVALPEILAAFVLPNDPAVARILGVAADTLRAHTGRSALNGYQDKSRERAWQQIAAIYQAIAREGIRYISPPASFEQTGQKVRFPSEIGAQRLGTCLDLALLFAACCEQAGLHPLLLMHEGHAYAGCWLVDRTLAEPVIDDLQTVRKLVELEELTVVELTALTGDAPGTLEKAELLAAPHLAPEIAFKVAIDLARARSARIHPLPIPGQPATAATPAGDAGAPAGIGERHFPADPARPVAASAKGPATRIDQWKSRLLDLSLRNRLLNFRVTKGSVQLLSAAPEHVEDELGRGAELRLLPNPEVMARGDPRDAGAYTRQQGADALAEHLREELAQGRLHTTLEEAEHAARLTDLYRAARLSIEENGTNTLFAAVGVLEWRETEHGDRTLRAPLLLVPVELRRKSVVEGFQLRRLDEDTRLNVTLMEMLRQHFHQEIAGLDPLPGDENGVDVAQVFRLFREAIRDHRGWEVKAEIWLGQFSFTKFLLWKDLSDRLDDLARNRVVQHLVHQAGTPYRNPADDIQPQILDDRFAPAEVFCPRSADSSQLAAVMAAAAGGDFVLEGPPGTGKSQTITNIIAHSLAHGRRVLFVAEKRAALDVVHRRLKEEGLAPFCLELHSNKAGKADVLAQFKEAIEFGAQLPPAAWSREAGELQKLRDALNGYVRALHREAPCGLSAYDCLDYLMPRRDEPTVALAWADMFSIDSARLEQCREAARQLAQRAELLGEIASHPLAPLRSTEWSPTWAEQARVLARKAAEAVPAAQRSAAELREWLRIPAERAGSAAGLATLRALVGSLLAPCAVGAAFVTTPWDKLRRELEGWMALVAERQKLRSGLNGYDEARLLALDLPALQQRWQQAQPAWFLAKWMTAGAVRRVLRTARTDGAKPAAAELSGVLERAIRLRTVNASLASASPAAGAALGEVWAGGEPTPEALDRAKAWGAALHEQIVALAGDDLGLLQGLRQSLAALFHEGLSTFARGTAIAARLERFARDGDAFTAGLDAFASAVALDRGKWDAAPDFLATTADGIERAIAGWPQIRAWCSWQRACVDADRLGLAPLCAAIEAGGARAAEAPAWFERSVRRALLDAILGRDEALRSFFGHEHRGRIDRFRELDERVTRLTRELIRARLAAGIPRESADDTPASELALLRKEIGKKTRHLPVRQLLSRVPALLPRLKPCVLMSPLSVAQYLDAGHPPFDVVVFDEASQIPVWDAIGAIARGTQLIVVGDPKQLPPTNFFNRTEEEATAVAEEYEDLESILDELLAHGLRHKRLQWHYRSRNEGLIAFSNRQYYANDLLTFPSPEVGHSAVRHHIVDARYDKGGTRTNRGEAEAVVAELVRRLRDPAHARRSYGIVTFSLAQQQLVENLLDEQRRRHPEIEAHFGEAPPVEGEPVFVKNLENVQGDERDVILFSICYGPDATGGVSMNFGPLNRDGGERRLNVAITRAKHEIAVFSTLRAEQIDLARTRARGVRDLKQFLEYAERGPRALVSAPAAGARPAATGNGADDSEFEALVAARLRALGHSVDRRVGCSEYRVDLAVVDPAAPGRYLLGIECDGPMYRRAATARDRDKLRQHVLEGLGWRLHRVWSSDWWHDPEAELARVTTAIARAAERAG